jgi:hypothetical protein
VPEPLEPPAVPERAPAVPEPLEPPAEPLEPPAVPEPLEPPAVPEPLEPPAEPLPCALLVAPAVPERAALARCSALLSRFLDTSGPVMACSPGAASMGWMPRKTKTILLT